MSQDWRARIAEGLNESFKHRLVDGCSCAMCGANNRRLALHVIKYAQDENRPFPEGFVHQSSSLGTARGGFGLCDQCAPPCPKCELPVINKQVKAFFEKIHGKLHSPDSPVLLGNGKCQHIWIFGRWPL